MTTAMSLLLWFLATLAMLFAAITAAYCLASNDIFFTFVPEGKLKTVMIGEKASCFLGRVSGYVVDSSTGDVTPLTAANQTTNHSNLILDQFGVTYIGLWPFATIDKYTFRWNEWDKEKDDIVSRSCLTDHVRFRFPYAIRIKGVETRGKVPITITVLITTRITNMDKARFKAGGEWLTNISGAVQSAARDWVGKNELEYLTSAQHETDNDGFVKYIMNLNNSNAGNKSLDEMFGVVIDAVNFLSYEHEGPGSERLREASTEAYVASQIAEAALKKAEADKEAAIKKAEGEATSIETIATAKAKAIRLEGEAEAEAIKKRFAAISTHENGAEIAIGEANAAALRDNKVATTWVIGQGSSPMIQIGNDRHNKNTTHSKK